MSTINWLEIFNKYNTQEIIMGKILKKVPGGFIVNVFGTEGFLPGSQVPQSLKEKGKGIVNNDINFKLIKINAFANNIVVSRTEILEQEKNNAYIEAMKDIHVGDIYDAVVKNIVSYGVFVTINNKIDGLIPSKELSWKFVNDNSQIVSINDKIKVKVINIDVKSHKISLSHKECIPSPWISMNSNVYYKNAIIDVTVSRVIEHGVIVTLENGCQGMLPAMEVAWDDSEPDLTTMFGVGDKLKVKVLSLDTKKQKILLSLRQVQNKPVNFIPIGKSVNCTIDYKTEDGLYLLTNKGISIFLPKTEISWVKKYDLNDYVDRNGKLKVKIIANAQSGKPATASLRQMYQDPMNAYVPKSIHKGCVSGELAKVYFVNFNDGLTGIILKESLHGYKLKKGLEIQTKVISSDKENRRIILELHRESEFSGNDIMEMLNLKPSRTVGILKKMLSDAVANGEIDTSYAAGSNFIREKAKDIL